MNTPSPQSAISLRRACSQDASQIASLGSKVFTLTFGHSVPPDQLQAYLDESYSLTAIAADINDASKDIIVATVDQNSSTIIGFAFLTSGTTEPCIEHLPNTVELQRIYVRPDYHGGGVGRLLAERLESNAREQGFEHMWLGVWEENVRAIKVYEKLGYRQIGDHDFAIGEIVQTDHIMVKEL